MMKVLVTGYAGQLGYDVVRQLNARGVECRGVDLADFSLTDADAVLSYVRAYTPTVIVHCAAYTNVDKAETEPEVCAAVNGMGTVNIVRAAMDVGAKLVFISTDYVFPGTGDRPWETGDPYGPKNVYGMTKVQGEDAVRSIMTRYFILRTSWVFGLNGNNFVKTMLRLSKDHPELRVVSDQIGSPTYSWDLARVICDMIPTDRYGVYHVRNEGYLSWADFSSMIMAQAGRSTKIIPVTTAEYGAVAHRPLNSRLSAKKLQEAGFAPMPPVEDALRRYLIELNQQ